MHKPRRRRKRLRSRRCCGHRRLHGLCQAAERQGLEQHDHEADVLEHVRRPDVVLRDPSEYASALAAELHGVPHWRVAIGIGTVEELGLSIAARLTRRVVA